MIDAQSIERLKQRCDIIEVIGSYIELRRAGANYSALCPFHDEKTPSFIVSPQKGYFTCFGCNKSGDSITFIMEKEHLTFYEAVEKLADMYNFTLEYTRERRDSSIYDYLAQISKFYQSNLNSKILDYLQSRGISQSSIDKFELGFSGESRALLQFLNSKKIPFDPLLEAGIIAKGEFGFYAKFNNRIMFPISAPNGKIIGFGGRDWSGNSAKYINSQQSKIFNKSRLLYGYNLARESIFKAKKIIVTEGYIDTIMMAQAGFSNVVATLGTALTKDHLPLLSRGEVDVLLCYDGDSAGINAALKASKLLYNKSGGVVIFSDNKDPADMIAEGKSAEILHKLNAPIPFVEFIISNIARKHDLKNPLQKEKALNEALAFFAQLSPLLQDEYRGFIASSLQVSPHLVVLAKNSQNFHAPDSKPDSRKTQDLKLDSRKTQDSKTQNAQNRIAYSGAGAQTAELVIIKSILEDKSFLDFSLEYINEEAFLHHKDAFKSLVSGDFEDARLIQILLNEKIIPLNFEAFREQMRLFIINAYRRKMRALKSDKKMENEAKFARLREIQEKLNILESGKLVRLL